MTPLENEILEVFIKEIKSRTETSSYLTKFAEENNLVDEVLERTPTYSFSRFNYDEYSLLNPKINFDVETRLYHTLIDQSTNGNFAIYFENNENCITKPYEFEIRHSGVFNISSNNIELFRFNSILIE